MGRLLRYNRPEWPFFVPALLGALVDGSVMPLCTIALVGAMKGGPHGNPLMVPHSDVCWFIKPMKTSMNTIVISAINQS